MRAHKSKPAGATLAWYDTSARHWTERNQDALGLAHLEDRLADWFWPGFSRRTTRAGYYVVVLYGLHAAETAAKRYGLPRNDDTRRLLFSRFERIWGMSQLVAARGAVEPVDRMLGIDGLSVCFQSKARSLPIDFLHLQQGEVGALGAYLPSLRRHRLVAPNQLRLTPVGWDIAQWMWDDPDTDRASFDDFIIKTLSPRSTAIPQRVGRVSLKLLGERARLSRLASRPALQRILWRRLFEERPPPADLVVLPQMAAFLKDLYHNGITEPREVLGALAARRSGGGQSPLRHAAQIALNFTDLGRTMLRIFDRMYQMVLAEGYAAEWSDCVQAAVTEDLVGHLDETMAEYRKLNCNEQIEALSAGGRVFGQIMRRFNTQNPYNTFESVLNMHTGSHRALSKGEGWLGRVGETVYLKQASTQLVGAEAERWQPTFRMGSMQRLLAELGELP